MANQTQRPRTRQRLDPDARYTQLLDAADEVFARVPYEQAQVEQIAEKVGASASLIYHYFPNKRSLFAAVVDRAVEELGRMTEPPEGLPAVERLRTSIGGYLDYVETYEHAYRAMHRGREAGDPQVHAAIERNTQRQIDRITDALAAVDAPKAQLELAARGALGLIITTCLEWLEHRQVDRATLHHMLVGSTLAAMAGAIDPPTVETLAASMLSLDT